MNAITPRPGIFSRWRTAVSSVLVYALVLQALLAGLGAGRSAAAPALDAVLGALCSTADTAVGDDADKGGQAPHRDFCDWVSCRLHCGAVPVLPAGGTATHPAPSAAAAPSPPADHPRAAPAVRLPAARAPPIPA